LLATCLPSCLESALHVRGCGPVGLTLDTYSHLLPAMHQQAAAAMDAILTG
jgi:hypothetical protein